MVFDGSGDGVDAVNDLPRRLRVGDLQAVVFIERDHNLERVHRIQPQTAWPEERLVVSDFLRRVLKHEVFHQHAFDLPFEFR